MKKILFLILSLLFIKPLFAQVPTQVIFWATPTKLVTYDPESCTYDIIAPLSTDVELFADIAFTPNNRLYGISPHSIREIDTATGADTPICIYSDPAFLNCSSLVHLNDSVLITHGNDSLYAINLNNCSITSLGYTGAWLDGDLTWYGGNLYGIGAEILYRFELNASNTAVTAVTALNDLTNPMPTGYALVTIGEDKNEGRIMFLGEYPKITSVNPETVIVDTGCWITPFTSCWGAATCIRYIDTTTVVDTTDDTDTVVTSINNLDDNIELKIYPNPVLGDKIHVQSGKGVVQSIRFYDNVGRNIPISHHSTTNEITISLPPNLASGIYILELGSDKITKRQKIMIR